MKRIVEPESMAPPAANYAHAVLTTGASRMLHTSGVVPISDDGTVPGDLAAQVEVVWGNILNLLETAGMEPADVISVTTYVVHGEDLAVAMAGRDRALGGTLAASTLVTVPALARPEWKMEISVIAAR